MNELPAKARVVIVGAGFAGAATAWALTRRGVTDVVVLEREASLGRYASGRSAGLGRQLADDDATTELTVGGAAVLRTLPIWSPTGSVLSFDDRDNAASYVARAERFGVAVELGGHELVAAHWPQLAELNCNSAIAVPSDGVIDVGGLLSLFLAGIRVELNCAVERLDGPTAITPRGAIGAGVLVDASGAWAGQLVGEALTSLKRHVFVMDSDVPAATPWVWHIGAGELYLRHDANGVMASPCDAAQSAPGHQDPDLVGEAHLRRLLDEVDSPLASAAITRRWACQRAFTPDRKMRLGADETRPWLVWAAGLGGHGATASPMVGERVASAVIDQL